MYDEQITTMRVRWEEVEGATGYLLLYNAINATQPTVGQEVRGFHGELMKGHSVGQLWMLQIFRTYKHVDTH